MLLLWHLRQRNIYLNVFYCEEYIKYAPRRPIQRGNRMRCRDYTSESLVEISSQRHSAARCLVFPPFVAFQLIMAKIVEISMVMWRFGSVLRQVSWSAFLPEVASQSSLLRRRKRSLLYQGLWWCYIAEAFIQLRRRVRLVFSERVLCCLWQTSQHAVVLAIRQSTHCRFEKRKGWKYGACIS
jgi:hypothetical protein